MKRPTAKRIFGVYYLATFIGTFFHRFETLRSLRFSRYTPRELSLTLVPSVLFFYFKVRIARVNTGNQSLKSENKCFNQSMKHILCPIHTKKKVRR